MEVALVRIVEVVLGGAKGRSLGKGVVLKGAACVTARHRLYCVERGGRLESQYERGYL